MFGFGWSRTAYINGGLGIPVKNNGVFNAYFQNNKNGLGTNYDAFGFLWCFDGTVLNTASDNASLKGREECHIFPNPLSINSSQGVNFSCSSSLTGYNLYTIEGKLLFSHSSSNIREGIISLSSGQIRPGIYVLVLETVQGKEAVKLVISE